MNARTLVFLVFGAIACDCAALECPPIPDQAHKDWDVTIKGAVGKIGPVKGAELENRTRTTTADVLGKLPQADRVYLEQMMYASYCSAIRDDKKLSESDKAARVHSYNLELRRTLSATKQPVAPVAREPAKPAVPDIHGRWISDVIHDRYLPDVAYRLRFQFEAVGGKVLGDVSEIRLDEPLDAGGVQRRIVDAKLDSETVAFHTSRDILVDSGREAYKEFYEGTVSTGSIKFARWDDRRGKVEHFVAKPMAPSDANH